MLAYLAIFLSADLLTCLSKTFAKAAFCFGKKNLFKIDGLIPFVFINEVLLKSASALSKTAEFTSNSDKGT